MTGLIRTAAAARDAALRQVEDGATDEERRLVREALDRVIAAGAPFTSEDVIAAMGEAYETIREPRLLGAVMRAAALTGRIVASDTFIAGRRRQRHGAPMRVWRPAISARAAPAAT